MLKYFNSLGLLPLFPNFMKDLGAMSSDKIIIFFSYTISSAKACRRATS